MPTNLVNIIEEIIEKGSRLGMTQKDISFKAGIDPANLSRLKGADDTNYSTLSRLASAVGLKLVLTPDSLLQDKMREGNVFDE